ncbi:Chloramphenicol acetyltransferase-like domain-containing protein [Cynara cardunculus var. scolymus]|uniref:Chloramphenicol acetyltransferase-like domain-containing protein n=2 Tax=Cynara cardunculus var. scolymus TaxID=59895 RepID=A0A103XSQ2_CYNCS|nr:Chloramphenicol acetyltransferase-like domain-containing protein [Cynara cardunculus var. scolymus]KVH96185.1 Chloramphenicol acetyltransferase-like domain-containing protein [Cynara cardunculus var. scolymus]
MIMAKLQRFGRIRQLHTIISQETIKPSSPTPPHLKTHNLSLLDRFVGHIHMPIVFFYPNYDHGDTHILKKSLSQSLTQYYPFAGRFPAPHAPHINCNDEGVVFLEASNNGRLDEFIRKKEHDETMDRLIPNGLGCTMHKTSPNLIEVQLNHFAGGGAALAVSISHKLADALTMASFFNHWATVTRGGSPINPSFVSSSVTNNEILGFPLIDTEKLNYVRRRFVFPNSKLYELKNKVNAMGTSPMNPSRVELLTSLLFKCAVDSATRKSGSLMPSNLFHTVNMRNRNIKKFPETAAGNLSTTVIAKIATDSGEIKLHEVIGTLRKGIMELEELSNVEEVIGNLLSKLSPLEGEQSRAYISSSMCRFPFYEMDFGWGKPVDIMFRIPEVNDSCVLLMDAQSGDGIEALVRLQEEEMDIFRKDKDLLAYVEDM